MDYKVRFLKQYLLGHKTNLDNQNQVLEACCISAYSDMLTIGRFFLSKNKELRDAIIKEFLTELKKKKYSFSRDLIDKLTKSFGKNERIEKTMEKTSKNGKVFKYDDYVTTFGLSQKFVNMCFKYFYVFEDNLPNIKFNFEQCDCPIDSVILKRLGVSNSYFWSKLKKDDYIVIQNLIQERLDEDSNYKKPQQIGRLAYDFFNW